MIWIWPKFLIFLSKYYLVLLFTTLKKLKGPILHLKDPILPKWFLENVLQLKKCDTYIKFSPWFWTWIRPKNRIRNPTRMQLPYSAVALMFFCVYIRNNKQWINSKICKKKKYSFIITSSLPNTKRYIYCTQYFPLIYV